RDRADLVESCRVDQLVDAFPDGQPPTGTLALHLVGAAHRLGQLLAPAQLLELGIPDHRAVSRAVPPGRTIADNRRAVTLGVVGAVFASPSTVARSIVLRPVGRGSLGKPGRRILACVFGSAGEPCGLPGCSIVGSRSRWR